MIRSCKSKKDRQCDAFQMEMVVYPFALFYYMSFYITLLLSSNFSYKTRILLHYIYLYMNYRNVDLLLNNIFIKKKLLERANLGHGSL
jgi:hypothetical protein